MKSARFVYPFVVFVFAALAIMLAAQSKVVVHVSLPTAPPDAQTLTPGAGLRQVAGEKRPLKFADAVVYDSGEFYPSSLAVGDLNGDGKLDIVLASWCQSIEDCENQEEGGVSVLLGNGDGTLQPPVSYDSGGINAISIAIGDVNGDGIPDLAVANCAAIVDSCGATEGEVSVLLGNGDGTFQAPVSYGSGGLRPTSIAIGDLNRDGKLDLVVAHSCDNEKCLNGLVDVLMGNGDGTFRTAVSYNSGGASANSVAIADVNGDGIPDLVVANCSPAYYNCGAGATDGEVSVLLGNGDGTFQTPISYSSGGYLTTSVATGDLNGDGHPDVVAVNCPGGVCSPGSDVTVLLNNGDGTFQPPVTYNVDYGPESVAIGDVNGDGKADLVVADHCGNFNCTVGGVSVLLGNGDGTFQPSVGYKSGGDVGFAVAIGDLNGDGRPDLEVLDDYANGYDTNGSVGVLLNSLTITTTTKLSSSPNPSQVNQTVTFTATIAVNPAVPDGEVVTFYNGATEIGTSKTTKGIATFTTSFSKAKTYTIKADYPGDAFHKKSSGTVKQVVSN